MRFLREFSAVVTVGFLLLGAGCASNKMVEDSPSSGKPKTEQSTTASDKTDKKALEAYMGTIPPDLSIIVRARSNEYLSTFINNPQKQLAGTSMPRVGLNEKAQNQVINYMEKVGDRKKAEREDLGYKLIGYMVLFTLLAYAWKVKIWKEVH